MTDADRLAEGKCGAAAVTVAQTAAYIVDVLALRWDVERCGTDEADDQAAIASYLHDLAASVARLRGPARPHEGGAMRDPLRDLVVSWRAHVQTLTQAWTRDAEVQADIYAACADALEAILPTRPPPQDTVGRAMWALSDLLRALGHPFVDWPDDVKAAFGEALIAEDQTLTEQDMRHAHALGRRLGWEFTADHDVRTCPYCQPNAPLVQHSLVDAENPNDFHRPGRNIKESARTSPKSSTPVCTCQDVRTDGSGQLRAPSPACPLHGTAP